MLRAAARPELRRCSRSGVQSEGRAASSPRASSSERHPLRSQERHPLGNASPGDGVRQRHDVLAAGMAGCSAPCSATRTESASPPCITWSTPRSSRTSTSRERGRRMTSCHRDSRVARRSPHAGSNWPSFTSPWHRADSPARADVRSGAAITHSADPQRSRDAHVHLVQPSNGGQQRVHVKGFS